MRVGSSAPSALVLDGHLRHAVDIVRSLGRHGWAVDLLTAKARPPAGYSKCARDSYLAEASRTSGPRVLRMVRALIESRRYEVALAAGLDGTGFLARYAGDLGDQIHVVAATPEGFAIAEDKYATTMLAESVGVAVPRTLAPAAREELRHCAEWTYPLVVKARGGQGRFAYARSFGELVRAHEGIAHPRGFACADAEPLPLVQEYIVGKGHGYYALCDRGHVLASFMHERVREVPPSGGPSSMARSFADPALEDAGRRVLGALKWTGVAMVEFKRETATGRYVLIEVNPKFWGSLGLAIAAGVDFPWLLVQLAMNGTIEAPAAYRDTAYQWLSMDIAHSMAVRRPFLWVCDVARGVPNDFRLGDSGPNAALLVQGAVDVARGRRRMRLAGPSSDAERSPVANNRP